MPELKMPELKMTGSLRRCMFVAMLAFGVALPAVAEQRLYQWTDAAGRVHFSDEAPADAEVQSSRSLERTPVLPAVATYRPVALPAGTLLPLAISLPDYSALVQQPVHGKFYVAADCINPVALQWADLQGAGSIFMEGNRRYVAESIASVLTAQGFDAEVAASEERWQLLAASGALRLVPKVVAVEVHVCAPRYTGVQVRQNDIPRLVQVSGERAGAWMKIRWELWRKGNKYPLRLFETEGAFMDWRNPTSLWNVMHESARQATRNLTGYPVLGKTLVAAAAPVPAAPVSGQDNPLLQWAESMTARFTLQARVASVMATVGPLKAMVVEHYLSEGSWPSNVASLGVAPAELRQEGLVDDVALGPQGEIIVTLSPQLYSRGYLRLAPKAGAMAVTWSCRSNLPAAALGGANGFCQSAAH